MKTEKITAIILAAGSSTRMSVTCSKQLALLCGESVVHRSVRAFAECALIDDVVVVCKAEELETVEKDLSRGISKPVKLVPGGKSRADSARIGFFESDADIIAIHDAARCLVSADMIERVVLSAIECGAATAACPISDTLKNAENGYIKNTVSRQNMFAAQTPQVFRRDLYKRALDNIGSECETVTDDNMLLEAIGVSIRIVDTGSENIKITSEFDLELAEFILKKRENMSDFRVGHGYDVHRFSDDRKLVLGGIEIPFDKGLLGHSDADVLTHAIIDALLGAASLGDIGRHFPDNDDRYLNISSLVLLENVGKMLAERNFTILNVDATLVIQSPKLSPYINKMISKISSVLGIDKSRVNIKATTEEHLGFTGSMEGVAAHAVAALRTE